METPLKLLSKSFNKQEPLPERSPETIHLWIDEAEKNGWHVNISYRSFLGWNCTIRWSRIYSISSEKREHAHQFLQGESNWNSSTIHTTQFEAVDAAFRSHKRGLERWYELYPPDEEPQRPQLTLL